MEPDYPSGQASLPDDTPPSQPPHQADTRSYYEWFIQLDAQLRNQSEKIHSIGTELAVVKDRTNDLPEIRKDVTEVKTTTRDIPDIKTDVKRLAENFWKTYGIMITVAILIQLIFAGIVTYIVRSLLPSS